MWVPFAVLLGLFSLLIGGLAGHKIAQNECQSNSVTITSRSPSNPSPDIETQK